MLGAIRNKSLQQAKEQKCDFYFVVDCDKFITPCTLKELVNKDKPIIGGALVARSYCVFSVGDGRAESEEGAACVMALASFFAQNL